MFPVLCKAAMLRLRVEERLWCLNNHLRMNTANQFVVLEGRLEPPSFELNEQRINRRTVQVHVPGCNGQWFSLGLLQTL